MHSNQSRRAQHRRGPRHEEVAEDLHRRLTSGEWPAGKRVPSFRRLAEEYRVSLGTVQRAFRTLKDEGMVRVTPDRPTVAALGASVADILEDGIALVLSSNMHLPPESGWIQEIYRGVQNALSRNGNLLMVLQQSGRWRSEFPAGLRHLPLKGVLLLGPFKGTALKAYEAMPIPVVLMDQPGDAYHFHSVALANFEAMFDATTRLIELGHRRLGFLRRLTWSLREIDPDSKERQLGFVAACKKAGIPEQDARIFTVSNHDAGVSAKDLARGDHPITALVTVDEHCAQRAVDVAQAAGLRVPKDVSIVTPAWARSRGRWSGPRVEPERIGRQAVELVLRKRETVERVRVPMTWFEGETIGPAPKRR